MIWRPRLDKREKEGEINAGFISLYFLMCCEQPLYVAATRVRTCHHFVFPSMVAVPQAMSYNIPILP